MRHLSLFSGIGGIDLGFERAGMVSVGQVEIDKQARTVLERHWPTVPRWEDVNEVHAQGRCFPSEPAERDHDGRSDAVPVGGRGQTGPRVSGGAYSGGGACDRCLPDFDVVTGGFPCQDISVAGKRAGLAGDRSGLWHQFARIIGESLPSWVVIENVPGLLSSNRGRDMGAILGTLADYGYGFAYRVLGAQWFGVAQRRRRVFIVGHLGGDGVCEVLAVGQGSAGDSPPSRTSGEAVAPTLAARAKGGGGLGTDFDLDGGIIGFAHQVGGDRSAADAWEDNLSPTLPKSQTMAVLKMREGSPGGGKGPLVSEEKAFTLSTSANEQTLYGSTLRRLTPTECARLQGFPDDWNDHLSDSARYKQFGNAVCVNVAEWIGRRLMGAANEVL